MINKLIITFKNHRMLRYKFDFISLWISFKDLPSDNLLWEGTWNKNVESQISATDIKFNKVDLPEPDGPVRE